MNFANYEIFRLRLLDPFFGGGQFFFNFSKICQNGIENFKRKKILRSHMYEKQYDIILGI